MTKQTLTPQQAETALAKAKKNKKKYLQSIQKIVDGHKAFLTTTEDDVLVGVGTIDLAGAAVYQWVDTTSIFTDGSTLSFSGSDWALSLILGECLTALSTLYVPLNQVPSSGYARVTALAYEEGGILVQLYDNNNVLLAQVAGPIEGIGLDAPLTVDGTYTTTPA